MPIDFWTTNGDTGASDTASVQPVSNSEPVNAAVDGRPVENLRIRTDILKQHVKVAEYGLAQLPLQYQVRSTNGPADAKLVWDGAFDPVGTTVVSTNGNVNSGRFWMNSTGTGYIHVKPANYVRLNAVARGAVTVDDNGYGTSLVFTSSGALPARDGLNVVRITVSPAALGVGVKATAVWSNLDSEFSEPISTSTEQVSAVSPPQAYKALLTIQIRNDGTTTVADIQNAVTASSATFGSTSPVVLPTPAGGSVSSIVSMGSASTAVLEFGVDSFSWRLSAATLTAFYNAGVLNTTLTAPVTGGASPQTIHLASVGSLIGSNSTLPPSTVILGFGTGTAEEVTVLTVDSGTNTITAVAAQNHSNTDAVYSAPNLLRIGDILGFFVGNAVERATGGVYDLTTSDLWVLHNGEFNPQDTFVPLVAIGEDPYASAAAWFAGGAHAFRVGASHTVTDYVHVGGVLTGSGDAPTFSSSAVASNIQLGIVELTYAAGTPTTPKVAPQDANGQISNTATGGNGHGFSGTANGSGHGVVGQGSSNAASAGVKGSAGTSAGYGVHGDGNTGSGTGVYGLGGDNNGTGVYGAGGGTTGVGVHGVSSTNGAAVWADASGTSANAIKADGGTNTTVVLVTAVGNAAGVQSTGAGTGYGGVFLSSGTGVGVSGTGGTGAAGVLGVGGTGGTGVLGQVTSGNGTGVNGQGFGTGNGVYGKGGATSVASVFGEGDAATLTIGVLGKGGGGGGHGGMFTAGNNNGAALVVDSTTISGFGRSPAIRTVGLTTANSPSSSLSAGDLYFDTDMKVWRVYYATIAEWSHTIHLPGTLSTGWSQGGGADFGLQYWMDTDRCVNLEGIVQLASGTTGSNTSIYTLPTGWLPTGIGGRFFPCAYQVGSGAYTAGVIEVSAAGVISFPKGADNANATNVNLDGIYFRTT